MPFLPYIYHKNNKQLPGRKVKDKQRAGTDEIRTKSPPSKPKGEITSITLSQNTKTALVVNRKGRSFPIDGPQLLKHNKYES